MIRPSSSSSNYRNKDRPTSTVVTALIGGGTIVSASVALGIYFIPKCVNNGQWNCRASRRPDPEPRVRLRLDLLVLLV
jgi:hypothetical protein